jgi:regulator of sirC expression with transglutaminase-like and TPR domain
MTKEEARAQFAEMVARRENDLELDRAALLIAAEEYPRLEVESCLAQLDSFAEIEELYGGKVKFHPAFLYAVTKRQILARMLQNLKGIYARAGDHHKTLAAIERALLINPEAAQEIRDRGLVYFGIERYAMALSSLEEYLRRAPQAADAKEIKERINQLRQRQAQLN